MSNREKSHNYSIRSMESRLRYQESKRRRRRENKLNNKFNDIDTFKAVALPMSVNSDSSVMQNATPGGTQIRVNYDDVLPCLPLPADADEDLKGAALDMQPIIQSSSDSPIDPVAPGAALFTQAFGHGPNDGKMNKLRVLTAAAAGASAISGNTMSLNAPMANLSFGKANPIPKVSQDGHTNTHNQKNINDPASHWNFHIDSSPPADWDIKNFQPKDIMSKGNKMVVANKVALRALDKAASLAAQRGHPPIKLTNQVHPSRNGAYRDAAYNKKKGGSSGSRHQFGDGYDVWCKLGEWSRDQRLALLSNLYACGFRGFGHGLNNIHVDTGTKRMWPYPGGVENDLYYDHSMFDGTCKDDSEVKTKKDHKGRKKIYCKKGKPKPTPEETKSASSHPPADEGSDT